MTKFSYQAFNQQRDIVNGLLEASDRAAAIGILTGQSLRPIEIKERGGLSTAFSSKGGGLFGAGHVRGGDLVMFTRQLSTMVGAGVPLVRGLRGLQKNADSKALSVVLQKVSDDVESGMTFADSLGRHPKTFNTIYVNMVRAGEAGGILDDILNRLATQQEKAATMKKKIRGAMAYPMVLLIIVVLAFFGLMLFVIPQIGKVVTNLAGPGATLPLLTRIMLGISGFIVSYWYIILLVGGGAIFFGLRFIRSPVGRPIFHKFILKVPVLNNVIIKTSVARFARTFSALLGAGVSIVESLNVTAKAIGNTEFEKVLNGAVEDVKAGKTLSSVIEKSPLFPAIVPQMLSVGEETGQIDTVLLKVADFYEEEVDVVINGLSAIIEPVMIVVMGAMVGLIVASVMGPITSLASQIH